MTLQIADPSVPARAAFQGARRIAAGLLTGGWPADVRDHARRLAAGVSDAPHSA
ncbi:hypothetical protein ACFW16_28070 [Inquilinus sp. NPDC058860]|uniref:hypothetical protein n=1 Tax=Inquilinus sp. NPDC058860 TaxID=3346652 RepID=UPI00368C51AB